MNHLKLSNRVDLVIGFLDILCRIAFVAFVAAMLVRFWH